jgi:hypothetical protein
MRPISGTLPFSVLDLALRFFSLIGHSTAPVSRLFCSSVPCVWF